MILTPQMGIWEGQLTGFWWGQEVQRITLRWKWGWKVEIGCN